MPISLRTLSGVRPDAIRLEHLDIAVGRPVEFKVQAGQSRVTRSIGIVTHVRQRRIEDDGLNPALELRGRDEEVTDGVGRER